MEISKEQLTSVTFGAVTVGENNDGYSFLRMTEKEADVYKSIAPYFLKTFSASGIRQEFFTDAVEISFEYVAERTTGVESYYFDIYINDILRHTFGEDKAKDTTAGSVHFMLPEGKNKVVVYLPSLHIITLKNITLGGATYIEPHRRKLNMVCYGDSITQGFCTKHPSLAYTNRLAVALNAEVYNKGVGGATFEQSLIDGRDTLKPDIVTVAYGTNDWITLTREMFEEKSTAFLKKASAVYSDSKIYVFTPLWRSDYEKETKFGCFWQVGEIIKKTCAELRNIIVLDGAELLPHSESVMADLVVHPDDTGHMLMAEHALRYIH